MRYAVGVSGSGQHDQRIRQRFTRTAEAFSTFALSTRSAEAEKLAGLLLADFPLAPAAVALDVACGPGTFTLVLARKVQFVYGVDLTSAMLEQAAAAAAAAQLSNLRFHTADAAALPFAAARFDLAVCGYSLHHMPDPAAAVAEMARVVRPGGRIGLADLIVPTGADAELHNRIERVRDDSHAATLSREGIVALAEAAGLRVRAAQLDERRRDFDEWMRVCGWSAADPAYGSTRELMEQTLENDAAGFRPARSNGPLEFSQISLFLIAEKPAP